MTTHRHPIACTIAGSDSGGGAGVQADLKTFHQFGVFGTSVLTAVTAQNTLGVTAVHALPLDVVGAQMEVLAVDLPPAAVKTGMLATGELVDLVADGLEEYGWSRLVVDPVMVATTGARLLAAGAEARVRDRLLPLAALATPNREEAELLTTLSIRSDAEAEQAARRLVDMGARAALIKGGHDPAATETVTDLLFDGREVHRFRHPRVRTRHTHGTGCTLSAAITAGMAQGRSLVESVESAVDFVARAIQHAPRLGGGSGPIDLFVPPPKWVSKRPRR